MSSLPSPFKSLIATDRGLEPTVKSDFAAKLSVAAPIVVVFSSTDTEFALRLALTMSSFPSPFRSPTATESGPPAVVTSDFAAKLSVVEPAEVVFRKTETVDELILAAAISNLPSPLRSPIVTERGFEPVVRAVLVTKLAVDDPDVVAFRRIDMLFEESLAIARSGLPSPFKSPIATEKGSVPTVTSDLLAKVGVKAPGVVVLSKIDVVLEFAFAVTRSGFPSPFRSPIATPRGPTPVVKSVFAE